MSDRTAGPEAAVETGPTEPVLLTERTPWGLRLTLNRPGKLNALSNELLDHGSPCPRPQPRPVNKEDGSLRGVRKHAIFGTGPG